MNFINEVELDAKKLLNKWRPIMEALSVSDEVAKLCFSVYCEKFSLEESKSIIYDDYFHNLLPVNLKILNNLNLEDKTIIVTTSNENTKDYIFDFKVKTDDIMFGLDVISQLEHNVVETISESINKNLEESDTLYVNRLVSSVNVIKEVKTIHVSYVCKFGVK